MNGKLIDVKTTTNMLRGFSNINLNNRIIDIPLVVLLNKCQDDVSELKVKILNNEFNYDAYLGLSKLNEDSRGEILVVDFLSELIPYIIYKDSYLKYYDNFDGDKLIDLFDDNILNLVDQYLYKVTSLYKNKVIVNRCFIPYQIMINDKLVDLSYLQIDGVNKIEDSVFHKVNLINQQLLNIYEMLEKKYNGLRFIDVNFDDIYIDSFDDNSFLFNSDYYKGFNQALIDMFNHKYHDEFSKSNFKIIKAKLALEEDLKNEVFIKSLYKSKMINFDYNFKLNDRKWIEEKNSIIYFYDYDDCFFKILVKDNVLELSIKIDGNFIILGRIINNNYFNYNKGITLNFDGNKLSLKYYNQLLVEVIMDRGIELILYNNSNRVYGVKFKDNYIIFLTKYDHQSEIVVDYQKYPHLKVFDKIKHYENHKLINIREYNLKNVLKIEHSFDDGKELKVYYQGSSKQKVQEYHDNELIKEKYYQQNQLIGVIYYLENKAVYVKSYSKGILKVYSRDFDDDSFTLIDKIELEEVSYGV